MKNVRFSAAACGLAFVLMPAGSATAQTSDPVPPASSAERAPSVDGAFAGAIERAQELPALQTLLISQDGETLVDEGFRGHASDEPTNIKSASKSVISALVGIAIDRGVLESVDQPIASILADKLPANPDPRLAEVTIGHLLSMQAGLERTSGGNYGGWIASDDWVRNALSRPFVDEPGGAMLYSTGSSHLLSAILTRESGRSTLELARDWLGEPAGVDVASWEQDPQGVYLGGNQMAMTPRSLLAFGELYRNEGRNAEGEQVIPADWITESWEPRTQSRFHEGQYGYGWFIEAFGGYQGYYGWGYGGQMIYVIPELELTVAITSDETSPSARSGYRDELHRLVAELVVPAAEARMAAQADGSKAG